MAGEAILVLVDPEIPTMQRIVPTCAVMVTVILSACAATLAPGAEQVRITKNASDVVTCKPLGSIQLQKNDYAFVTGPAHETV